MLTSYSTSKWHAFLDKNQPGDTKKHFPQFSLLSSILFDSIKVSSFPNWKKTTPSQHNLKQAYLRLLHPSTDIRLAAFQHSLHQQWSFHKRQFPGGSLLVHSRAPCLSWSLNLWPFVFLGAGEAGTTRPPPFVNLKSSLFLLHLPPEGESFFLCTYERPVIMSPYA